MEKLLYVVAILCLASCVQKAEIQDPYENVPPLFNGDSLNKVYPLALRGNIIQREEFEKAMIRQIMQYKGRHMECLEISPWEVDKMMEINPDSFYVSFNRAIPGAVLTISTRLPREVAANLEKYEWYEVKGIFEGFPPSPRLIPHIDEYEIKLGVYEYDSTEVRVYPEEKRAYWEKYIEDYDKY